MTEVIPRVSEPGQAPRRPQVFQLRVVATTASFCSNHALLILVRPDSAGAGHVDLPTDHVELVRRVLPLVERGDPAAPAAWRGRSHGGASGHRREGTGCRRARGPAASVCAPAPRRRVRGRRRSRGGWRARPPRRSATSTVRRHCRSARTWRRRCGRAARRGRAGRPSGCGCGRSRSPRGASTRTRALAEATAARELSAIPRWSAIGREPARVGRGRPRPFSVRVAGAGTKKSPGEQVGERGG